MSESQDFSKKERGVIAVLLGVVVAMFVFGFTNPSWINVAEVVYVLLAIFVVLCLGLTISLVAKAVKSK